LSADKAEPTWLVRRPTWPLGARLAETRFDVWLNQSTIGSS
jgi:hypothetical protein